MYPLADAHGPLAAAVGSLWVAKTDRSDEPCSAATVFPPARRAVFAVWPVDKNAASSFGTRSGLHADPDRGSSDTALKPKGRSPAANTAGAHRPTFSAPTVTIPGKFPMTASQVRLPFAASGDAIRRPGITRRSFLARPFQPDVGSDNRDPAPGGFGAGGSSPRIRAAPD